MNTLVFFLGLATAFCIVWLWIELHGLGDDLMPGIAVCVFACFTYGAWDTPESLAVQAARDKAKQEQHDVEVTPRRVSSADGCTVYAFKPQERWLYFTKCDNAETTTQNQWTVHSGKTHHEETMEIKTK